MNDNFGVKVSENTINKVLHAHDIEWTKPILRPKSDERIKKSRIKFSKYYLYIVDNARYVYTDESHFYTKNSYSERWVFPGEEFHEEQRKSGNQWISVYGAISRKAKFALVYFTGNMDSKKIEWVSEILTNIREIFVNKFVLYMDNDAKHVSVETLKWYSSCEIEIEIEIEIETGPPHSPDINLTENVWGIIKKRLKGHELKIFN